MKHRTTFRDSPVVNSPVVEAAKLMRTVRSEVGGAAMGGPPPKPDVMDSDSTRMDIAMENFKQEHEGK